VRTLEVETVVVFADGPRVVARSPRRDEGTWAFGFTDPWHMLFQS